MIKDELILVDIFDSPLGYAEKLAVHKEGLLHRAFSIFLMDEDRMLIQQRSSEKYHCAGIWANACCSHPRRCEDLRSATSRRLREELGISCPVEEEFAFVYRAVLPEGLIEFEFDHVFVGTYNGACNPNPAEIQALRWIQFDELSDLMRENPHLFGPWFLTAAPRVMKQQKNRLII